MLIDTHTHLYLKHFKDDIEETIIRAKTEGIEKFYLPNIDAGSIDSMLELENKFPGVCFPMMGLHPCSVKENYREELTIVKKWLDKRPFCAVGEIGIDLYWDKTFLEEQKKAFITQAGWAKELGIPIVIHARESLDMLIELVKQEKDDRLQGIFHCFTGNLQQARQIMELGFYLGIGGVLTYKNSGLDKTVKDIPLDWLVLETDSPYLTPVPYRGKRNESAYIKIIAQKMAEIKDISLEDVAVTTTANGEKIFAKNSLTYTTLY
ncbi:MAG: TatD family hydrolase [Bacteroidota bacterium]